MVPAVDLAPALRLLLLAALIALLPLALWWWRHRRDGVRSRQRALALLVAFLTFDLIVFGAFTRLTDSGLGCPDWPGCYGHASPLGAAEPIQAAQAALPSGPVTAPKAWIEMIHRYLAMTVGALIVAMLVLAWRARRALPLSPAWPLATLAWVIVQGLFGKYTVTLKLQPAIVTLHLLGGLLLLALLVRQAQALRDPPAALPIPRAAVALVLGLAFAQAALGGWVSSNYAVLACSGFPACNGQWWPEMDWSHAFTLTRELGRAADGGFLPFPALVAVHWTHRAGALVLALALLWLGLRLLRTPAGARQGALLLGLLALQVASGASNVVLDWPLAGALVHSAGAAALVAVLTMLLGRASSGTKASPVGAWSTARAA
jgi:cytochrome c oxidase assembly protein subunit 15